MAASITDVQAEAAPTIGPNARNERARAIDSVRWQVLSLRDASEELRADREVVLEAVRRSGLALQYASEGLRADKDVVLEALKLFGGALSYASSELRADREVVSKAVWQNGGALQFASEELQADKDVVLEAVAHDGYALKYASQALRGDLDVVLQAVKQNHYALNYAAKQLQADQDLVLLAARGVVGSQHFFFTADIQAIYARASFARAKLATIAVRGEEAPVLTVTLTRAWERGHVGQDAKPGWMFQSEVSLMSGATFVCCLPDCGSTDDWGTDRPHPILDDLAKKLANELPNHCQAPTTTATTRRIFLIFRVDQTGGSEETIPVTPWDWERPLSDFLHLGHQGDVEPPAKRQRT